MSGFSNLNQIEKLVALIEMAKWRWRNRDSMAVDVGRRLPANKRIRWWLWNCMIEVRLKWIMARAGDSSISDGTAEEVNVLVARVLTSHPSKADHIEKLLDQAESILDKKGT